jgi:hypothetical protein
MEVGNWKLEVGSWILDVDSNLQLPTSNF